MTRTQTKFTPGFWEAVPDNGIGAHRNKVRTWIIRPLEEDDSDGPPLDLIGEIYGDMEPDSPRNEANAHLVQAAPSMYAALEHAEAILSYAEQISTNKGGEGPNTTTRYALGITRAALKSARGET